MQRVLFLNSSGTVSLFFEFQTFFKRAYVLYVFSAMNICVVAYSRRGTVDETTNDLGSDDVYGNPSIRCPSSATLF